MARRRPGSVWALQPHTATTAPGACFRARRTACRDFLSLTAVTAQLLMT